MAARLLIRGVIDLSLRATALEAAATSRSTFGALASTSRCVAASGLGGSRAGVSVAAAPVADTACTLRPPSPPPQSASGAPRPPPPPPWRPVSLTSLAPAPGSVRPARRVGRGPGSRRGGTSGAGHKGHKARSGSHQPYPLFEGGAKHLARKLPRRGASAPATLLHDLSVVSLDRVAALVRSGRLRYRGSGEGGDGVKSILDSGDLQAAGAAGHTVRDGGIYLTLDAGETRRPLEGLATLLGGRPLRLRVARCAPAARAALEAAGGGVEVARHRPGPLRRAAGSAAREGRARRRIGWGEAERANGAFGGWGDEGGETDT